MHQKPRQRIQPKRMPEQLTNALLQKPRTIEQRIQELRTRIHVLRCASYLLYIQH